MAESTKILFLISRFLDGGIDTVLVEYLRYLSANSNYHITLGICVSMDELEVFMQNIPDNIKVHHFVKAQWLTKWRKRKIKRGLPSAIKIYDEAFLSPIRRSMIAREIKKLSRCHDVVIDFDCCSYSFLKNISIPKIAWFHFSFKAFLKRDYRRARRIGRMLEHYDKVVVISETMRREGAELFPQIADKLKVIYNAKDRNCLIRKSEEDVCDDRIQQPYILAVERLVESQKDITTLLHAYSILRKDFHHEELLILLGKGRSENMSRQTAKDLGIADSVHFIGFHSNPYPWMKRAKLLAHSAKFEGLPTVLIEGLMLDKLMVSSDCPTGPREILDDGRAGLLVPVADAQAMAEAIHRLLTDTSLQSQIKSDIEKHRYLFTFECTQMMFEQMINEIL